MNRIGKEKKICIVLIVASTLIASIMANYSMNIYKNEVDSYKLIQNTLLTSSGQSAIKSYEKFSNFIFEAIVNDGETTELMHRASTTEIVDKLAMAEIRRDLFEHLKKYYDIATQYSVGEMQFHLPNGDSFLRFNSPDKHGDNLMGTRSSVRIANEEKRYVAGFEIGRATSAYRFVYPLEHQGMHVGSIEVSFSIKSILAVLKEMNPDKSLGLILKKEIVEATAFEEVQSSYNPSFISDEFVIEEDIYKFILDNNILYQDEKLVDMLKYEVQPMLETQESFCNFIKYEGNDYLVQFEAVHDIDDKPIGYLLSIESDTQFSEITKIKNIKLASIVFAYFLFVTILISFVRIQRKINSLAMFDPLTKVYNRYSFFEFAHKEITRSARTQKPICFALLDIDHFKKVNDKHGHVQGDNVLKKLVDITKESIREFDVLGRYGGEEFILMFPETTIEEAAIVAERIRSNIENHNFTNVGKVTVSIGYAKKAKGENIDQVIERTDEALYCAKNNGRNQISVSPDALSEEKF